MGDVGGLHAQWVDARCLHNFILVDDLRDTLPWRPRPLHALASAVPRVSHSILSFLVQRHLRRVHSETIVQVAHYPTTRKVSKLKQTPRSNDPQSTPRSGISPKRGSHGEGSQVTITVLMSGTKLSVEGRTWLLCPNKGFIPHVSCEMGWSGFFFSQRCLSRTSDVGLS